MTIEEHIENLKAIASYMPSDKCSDWIESLMAGINAMEELKAHREAWEKVELRLKELSIVTDLEYYVHREDSWFDGIKDAIKIVDKYRPNGGDTK